jgi:hypothetical protein
MRTIQAQVPDPPAKHIEELAEQEKVSVDQLVSIALAYQVSAWRRRDTMADRARRGNRKKLDRVVNRKPDRATALVRAVDKVAEASPFADRRRRRKEALINGLGGEQAFAVPKTNQRLLTSSPTMVRAGLSHWP